MAKIQDLLFDKQDQIDYNKLLERNPWIGLPNQKCILSPDSDGLLCGLFMSHYLNWEIIGFYDGKVCLIKEGISAYDDNVCFLDIEIYREGIKSMGHHLITGYNTEINEEWKRRFRNCIQPNLLRKYDKNSFRLKYPLATIHMLIGILEGKIDIKVEDSAIFPLLFTDGTFNVMFSYPENVMNWWNYLRVQDNSKLLNSVFLGENYTVYKLMLEMDNFFRERDKISAPRERGDRLKISNKDGSPYNIEKIDQSYRINTDAQNRCILFLDLLSNHTKWELKIKNWNFKGFKMYQFTKSDFKGMGWTITKNNWRKFMELNPISWAMTSSDNIEFTIEEPDSL